MGMFEGTKFAGRMGDTEGRGGCPGLVVYGGLIGTGWIGGRFGLG